jgi:hypothetical protein
MYNACRPLKNNVIASDKPLNDQWLLEVRGKKLEALVYADS